jgi:hypothetical protein
VIKRRKKESRKVKKSCERKKESAAISGTLATSYVVDFISLHGDDLVTCFIYWDQH